MNMCKWLIQIIELDIIFVPLISTMKIAISDILLPLLDSSSKIKNQPFLLVGPEGSGKSLLLHHCFKQVGMTVKTIDISSRVFFLI